jgi:alkylhydroperoxidase family enzyme
MSFDNPYRDRLRADLHGTDLAKRTATQYTLHQIKKASLAWAEQVERDTAELLRSRAETERPRNPMHLTQAEVAHLCRAGRAKGQSEEELVEIVRWADRIRLTNQMLDAILEDEGFGLRWDGSDVQISVLPDVSVDPSEYN